MNQVVLVGNLTDDVELRYTQSGLAVANFTLAVSCKERHDGTWQDVTDGFFRCYAGDRCQEASSLSRWRRPSNIF